MNQPAITIYRGKEAIREIFDVLDVAPSTKRDYGYRIGSFLQFIKKDGFTPQTYRKYKEALRAREDLTASTKNKYLVTARIFCKELQFRGELPFDITANTKSFKQDKKHKRDGITHEEMIEIAAHLERLPENLKNLRLKAIVSLLALQGLRQIEAVRLDYEDVKLPTKTLYIMGKGRDDKEPVHLHPETARVLSLYMKKSKIGSGPLFKSLSNRRSSDRRLTTRAIQKEIQGLFSLLGVEGKSAHGFRHYFVTTLIEQYKQDIAEVAKYSRHNSLEMLQVYNDAIKTKKDLPRFYEAFAGVSF